MYIHEKKKNDSVHMLLSTTYDFNNSHTKRLHMELPTINEGAAIKIGNNASGIYFDTESWQFLYNLNTMNKYLSRDEKLKPNFIIIKISLSALSRSTKQGRY